MPGPRSALPGCPRPRADERVVLWVQNSHAVQIPAGALALDRMGANAPVALDVAVPPFATLAVDVADVLPGLEWPAQIEFLAGRHVVRPRYEVVRGGAHAHRPCECGARRSARRPRHCHAAARDGARVSAALPGAAAQPLQERFVLPTPMAHAEQNTPLRLDVFAPDGMKVAERFLGVLPRNHDCAVDLDDVLPPGALPDGGHAELVYDFRDGGEANGWLHALFRFEEVCSGHAAESSFGAHIFNTLMVYKNEPQSYTGKPPGLSTRLFLKLGFGGRTSFCVLIYPASGPWVENSSPIWNYIMARARWWKRSHLKSRAPARLSCVLAHFSASICAAGERGYVLIRDTTCRLFGFHGVDDGAGGFSFDHMFGF